MYRCFSKVNQAIFWKVSLKHVTTSDMSVKTMPHEVQLRSSL